MIADAQFARCALDEVRDFVTLNHYSRSCPNAGIVSHCFSANVAGLLVGAAVFAHTAGTAKTGSIFKHPYDTKEYCRELIRFVMVDVMPQFSESQFIGWLLRYLKKHSYLFGLLSYADPEHDHNGTIYNGSNWRKAGMSAPTKKLIVDGVEMHTRRATNLYGTCSVAAIRAMGHTVDVRTAKPKHRFVYVLQKEMMPFVKYPIPPFGSSLPQKGLDE